MARRCAYRYLQLTLELVSYDIDSSSRGVIGMLLVIHEHKIRIRIALYNLIGIVYSRS